MKDCQKAAGLMILSFLLLLCGVAPAAAGTDDGNKSVDTYYQIKESNGAEPAGGKGSEVQEEKDENKVGMTILDVVKMIFALLFVVLLLVLLLTVVNKRSKGFSHGQMIQKMGGTPLGGNRSLQIVRVGEKILVLGVGENVQLLELIEDSRECSRMIEKFNEKTISSPSTVASRWMKEQRKKNSSTFASQLSAQLDEMKAKRRTMKEHLREERNRNG